MNMGGGAINATLIRYAVLFDPVDVACHYYCHGLGVWWESMTDLASRTEREQSERARPKIT